MNTLSKVLISSFIFLSINVSAVEIGDITMPDKLQAGSETLILNGAGIRSKFIFGLYVAGLYLTEKSNDATAIIQSNEAMALRLHIISSKITSNKMTKATRKGFDKAIGGKTETISAEIEQFLTAFSDKIVEGDVFEFVSIPQKGVVVSKNGNQKLTVSSLVFKQALFGIWLSKKPVKEKLKNNLLGL